jgi:hypothetical protein
MSPGYCVLSIHDALDSQLYFWIMYLFIFYFGPNPQKTQIILNLKKITQPAREPAGRHFSHRRQRRRRRRRTRGLARPAARLAAAAGRRGLAWRQPVPVPEPRARRQWRRRARRRQRQRRRLSAGREPRARRPRRPREPRDRRRRRHPRRDRAAAAAAHPAAAVQGARRPRAAG